MLTEYSVSEEVNLNVSCYTKEIAVNRKIMSKLKLQVNWNLLQKYMSSGGKLKLIFACVRVSQISCHAEMSFSFPCPKGYGAEHLGLIMR